ncbi:uncharacterized protein BDR25DRAFT_287455 [Lindgomyces ingoldianus]|uniref:Uncharacterized protein n=1 Tax=Lindgomyces ingoldianus TaxID=673940 RepID=A0ACB6QU28_9PLEO|nr:uncharacterized protein BDR25DRAFT_287455 [Lindgomyces ingoldianus]KAF2470488.1 hypothetical protein BDR25DRAFT_287455 [Lindgomyces ingoldianus]
MAAPNHSSGLEKRKRSKKKKSRTLVLSSDSESDVDTGKKSRNEKGESVKKSGDVKGSSPEKIAKKGKKEKKRAKSDASSSSPLPNSEDATTARQGEELVDTPPTPAKSTPTTARPKQDFTSIYLHKVTTELADDLDKVREANDFTNRSLPMLIHALKQGESIFGAEERKRVESAANV